MTTLKLMALYISVKNVENKLGYSETHRIYRDQIDHTIGLINSKLIFLIPPGNRAKRGLINALGTIVKSITGNLDHEDAVKYEQQITVLKNQINNVHDKQKLSIILAENTTTEFSNQLRTINDNQRKLSEAFLNITSRSNIVYNHIHFLDIYIQIDFSLQIILEKLDLSENAMTFARLGIMHPSIISSKDLILEMIKIKKNINFNPVSEININNIHKIESSINVKAYSTEHSLNFILEIPSVSQNTYDLIHLYPIPSRQNLTIIPPSKYLALGSDKYAYLEDECRSITNDLRMCKQLDKKQVTDTEDCITSLIQQRSAHCSYAKMALKTGKVQKIDTSSWLVITTSEQTIISSCGEETQYQTVDGTYIISVPSRCEAKIMNKTLQTHSSTIIIHDIIPLPKERDIKAEDIQYDLKLNEIDLDKIHQLVNKAEEIKQDDFYSEWPAAMTIPSWSTVVLYVIGTTIVIWKLYRCWSSRNKRKIYIDPTGGPDESCGTQLHSKKRGVTMSKHMVNADDAALTRPQVSSSLFHL